MWLVRQDCHRGHANHPACLTRAGAQASRTAELARPGMTGTINGVTTDRSRAAALTARRGR